MGAYSRFASGFFSTIGHKYIASGSRTNVLLNTAYTHKGGAGNNAVAIRYTAHEATAIDELYLFMDAHGGTIANITCECKIYNESSASIPSTTVRATSTAVAIPSADDKWIKVTFGTPYTPTVGEILWFLFYTTNASPTVDYPQIMTHNGTISFAGTAAGNTRKMRCYTSTDGFQTGTAAAGMIALVKHAGGTVVGYPFTIGNAAPYASNTRKRGMLVESLTADLSIDAMEFPVLAAISGIEVFKNGAGPGTTPDSSWVTGADTNEITDELIGFKQFDTPYVMQAGNTYYWVYTLSSASTGPTVYQIEDYASYSSVFDAVYGTPNVCCSIIDDGASGWTIDRQYGAGSTLLLVGNQVAASSGGGGPLVGPGRLVRA